MKNVFKYSLEEGVQVIHLPAGAEPLSVAYQRSPGGYELKMWAVSNVAVSHTQQFTFYVVGTGDAVLLPDTAVFLGTVLSESSYFVHHVWYAAK
jgi:hypothetical protein